MRLLQCINKLIIISQPVYADTSNKTLNNSLLRSPSCPELIMYQHEGTPHKARHRSYSENDPQLSSTISTNTLNRTQSDSDIHRIDRTKTFEGSENMFGNADLLTQVVSALGSIRPYDEDGRSCLELGIEGGRNGFSDSQILSSERRCSGCSLPRSDGGFTGSLTNRRLSEFQGSRVGSVKSSKNWTWSESNSQPVAHSRSVSLDIPEDEPRPQDIVNRISHKTNLSKSGLTSEQGKRNSLTYQEMGLQSYLDRSSAGRESIISLPRQYLSATTKGRNSVLSILDAPVNATNSSLLERTSIADLIRALEVVHTQSNSNNVEKEIDSLNTTPNLNNLLNQNVNSRRGSLRPVPGYTTIFTSTNVNPIRKISSMSNPEPSILSRHLSLRPQQPPPPYTAMPKPLIRQSNERPSQSNNSSERSNPSIPAPLLLQKKLPLGPSPLARIDTSQDNVPVNRSQGTSTANKNIFRRSAASRTRHISLSNLHENGEKKYDSKS